MSATVIYLPEARDDVDGTYLSYEQRSSGLGERFLEQLRTTVERIQFNPELYGVFEDEVRAVPLRQFPYVIYYRIAANSVVILAVLDGRRDPKVWRSRT